MGGDHTEENVHTHMRLHPGISAKRGIWTGINNAVPNSHIGQHKNVDASGPKTDDALLYNVATKKWTTKGLDEIPTIIPQNIADLKDVNKTDSTPFADQILTFAAATSSWEYASAPGALSTKLEDLSDVDIKAPADIPDVFSRIQWNGVDKWIVGPVEIAVDIYVFAGQPATNTGLSGSKVPTVELGLQRALQIGSVAGMTIHLEGAVTYTTSATTVLNANNISGPCVTPLLIKGQLTDLSVDVAGGSAVGTTGELPNGLKVEVNNGGLQTIANGWAINGGAITTPENKIWGEIQSLNGGKITLPIVIDSQANVAQNNGKKLYASYGNMAVTAGFSGTPQFKTRDQQDIVTITDNLTVKGPVKFSNLKLTTAADKTIKFEDTSLEYVHIKPGSGRTSIHLDQTSTKCDKVVFEDIDLYVNGGASIQSNLNEVFRGCVFKNCTFKQCNNASFVSNVFYNCPHLFGPDSKYNVDINVSLHLYSNDSTAAAAAVANIKYSNLRMSNSRFAMYKFTTDPPVPITIPLFISDSGSMIDIRESFVPDAVFDTTTALPDLYKPTEEAAFMRIVNEGKAYIWSLAITDDGAGTRAIFLLRNKSSLWLSQEGATTAGLIKVENHTFVLTSDSDVFVTHMIDQLKAKNAFIGLRSNIKLGPIVIESTGNTLGTNFMTVTDCNVVGGGITETASNDNEANDGIYVNLATDPAIVILEATRSNVDLGLQALPADGNGTLTGHWLLDNSNLKLHANNHNAETTTHINLTIADGTHSKNYVVRADNRSSLDFTSINIFNLETDPDVGVGIELDNGSSAYLNYPVYKVGTGITSIASPAITLTDNSSMLIKGKITTIGANPSGGSGTIAFNLISVTNNSDLTILPTVDNTDGAAVKLELKRQIAGTNSASLIVVDNNSKFHIENMAANKATNKGSGTPLHPNDNIPVITLNAAAAGKPNFEVTRKSEMTIGLCKIDHLSTNTASHSITTNSTLTLSGCFISQLATTQQTLFIVNNSNLYIRSDATALSLTYTPQILVDMPDQNSIINSDGGNIELVEMEFQSNNAPTNTQRNGIVFANNSKVLYFKPTKQALETFYEGARGQRQSQISYQVAGGNGLVCFNDTTNAATAQDVVLGFRSQDGESNVGYRKTTLEAGIKKALPDLEGMEGSITQANINITTARCQNSIAGQINGPAPT